MPTKFWYVRSAANYTQDTSYSGKSPTRHECDQGEVNNYVCDIHREPKSGSPNLPDIDQAFIVKMTAAMDTGNDQSDIILREEN